jgi:hypothetical protein
MQKEKKAAEQGRKNRNWVTELGQSDPSGGLRDLIDFAQVLT